MKTTKTSNTIAVFVFLAIAITWTTTYAANNQNQQSKHPNRGMQSQKQSGQQSQQQQGQRRIVIDPEAWIRVGYDFDNDGRTDTYEYIMGYDLRVARARSAARQDRQDVAQRLRQQQTVSGTVEDMKQIKLAGVKQQHVLIKLSSNGRTLRADLGAKNQIDKLNINKGDQITVEGVPGSINNKRMLMATKVQTQDKSTTVRRQKGQGSLRFEGTISKLKEIRLEKDQSASRHVVALVQLKSGRKVPLDLGRTSEHQKKNLEFSDGDDLIFIARPARVKGKTILTAEKINIDGKTHEVDWVKDARKKMRQQQKQQQQKRSRTGASPEQQKR